MSGSFNPCSMILGLFVFVFAVGVAVAVIVPMFGTVVNYLVPVVSFAVFLHVAWFGQCLTLSIDGRLGSNGWNSADGVSRMHSLFQFIDLLFQLVIADPFFLQQSK